MPELKRTHSLTRSAITTILSPTSLTSGSSEAFSSTFNALGYRSALVYMSLSSTGVSSTKGALNPSTQFIPQFSTDTDGTTGNWYDLREGVWTYAHLIQQTSTELNSLRLPLAGRRVRFLAQRNSTQSPAHTVSIRIEAKD